ncbi:TetR/AcrR family transcriptional regulator [Streptomyces albiaxialis]|uniref:TetR/AcrR family transcriptional regulator n=1 Tax=Streptomyces albiaxialis TaxID=329523 RepID=A0ABN2VNM0_9ACTN
MASGGRGGGGTAEQRRARVRLEISREAARLFWAQGVAATSGAQIAGAAGVSTRTVWRHFRSKESCAEPVVTQGALALVRVLRRWPRHSSLEEHLVTELSAVRGTLPPAGLADELLGMRMIVLAGTEPALRTAWLMACDQTERELGVIIGERLGRPVGDLEVRTHAAAAAAVVRVLDEHIGAAVLADADLTGYRDVPSLSRHFAHAIHTATRGIVGEPVGPVGPVGPGGPGEPDEPGEPAA